MRRLFGTQAFAAMKDSFSALRLGDIAERRMRDRLGVVHHGDIRAVQVPGSNEVVPAPIRARRLFSQIRAFSKLVQFVAPVGPPVTYPTRQVVVTFDT
jgi:hypothetical protein